MFGSLVPIMGITPILSAASTMMTVVPIIWMSSFLSVVTKLRLKWNLTVISSRTSPTLPNPTTGAMRSEIASAATWTCPRTPTTLPRFARGGL